MTFFYIKLLFYMPYKDANKNHLFFKLYNSWHNGDKYFSFYIRSIVQNFQTNSLLSAMAFADLALLFCMLPHSLASFEFAYRCNAFRYFYYVSKRQLNAFANLFSAAAAWLDIIWIFLNFLSFLVSLQTNTALSISCKQVYVRSCFIEQVTHVNF